MSEPTVPPGPPPGPPPSQPPPPPPGPTGPGALPPPPPAGGGVSQNRSLMIVLSYLWILALVPLLVEKDDREVQWHAKHGLVLLVAEIVLWIAVVIVGTLLAFVIHVGCLGSILYLLVWVGVVILRILCIVKGVNGQRLIIPGISQYADRF